MPTPTPLRLRQELDRAEKTRLSPHACRSDQALRREPDPVAQEGHRQQFSVDADRILHSLSYTRYIDKTQVFSLIDNDHITHRVLHVQLVSKIARTIGRMLRLNEDLIEAVALGHDIGHPPFGHDGEKFLDAKCRQHGIGPFLHNVQSVHFLQKVERRGRGLNLSLQVLDGVLTHDGEDSATDLSPQRDKDFARLESEMAAKLADPGLQLTPMTLEGCVVRLSDTVAYIGRDLEDAIRLGLIKRSDLPAEVTEVLGSSNGTIVYRLVEDLVSRSVGHDRVGFSPEVAEALTKLKRFNLERIYLHPAIKTQNHKIRAAFDRLFEAYLEDVQQRRQDSPVVGGFLRGMDESYLQTHKPAEVVRDFLAGMTDEFFLANYRRLVWPGRITLK